MVARTDTKEIANQHQRDRDEDEADVHLGNDVEVRHAADRPDERFEAGDAMLAMLLPEVPRAERSRAPFCDDREHVPIVLEGNVDCQSVDEGQYRERWQ